MDQPLDQFSLLKSHIDAYTKKDGTTVKAHETRIEAHGVKGMKSTPWRKEFKSEKHLADWMTKQDGNAELHGVREMEQSDPASKPAAMSASARHGGPLKVGERVKIKPEFQDEGDDDFHWHVVGDESKGRVDVSANIPGMKIQPTHTLQSHMVDRHESSDAPASNPEKAAIPASAVNVVGEDRYEFTHGKKPGGRGSYIFSPHKTHDFGAHGSTAGEHYFQSAHDSGYTDAKVAAKKWAAGKGHSTIHVQT